VRDALEFLIAGASAVGVGTALFYDPLACRKINAGIASYLARHGLDGIAGLVGSLELPGPVPDTCSTR
jgi:dihydroorotate dehydrogenase (NAD+) catalytic subunit